MPKSDQTPILVPPDPASVSNVLEAPVMRELPATVRPVITEPSGAPTTDGPYASPRTEAAVRQLIEAAPMRLEPVDALRGAAALMVVMHHAWAHAGVYASPALTTPWFAFPAYRAFSYGYIGVDLFLVLSGFCLSWPYFTTPDREFSLKQYVHRRFWRIYPPYLIVFLALLIAGLIVRRLDPTSDLDFAKWQPLKIAAGLLLQATALSSSFWSLCLELRWYVLFPLVLLWSRRFPAWPVLLVTAAASYLLPTPHRAADKVSVYLPVFVAGVWAAQILASRRTPLHQWVLRLSLPALLAFSLALVVWLPDAFSAARGSYAEAYLCGGVFFFLLIQLLKTGRPLPRGTRWLAGVGVFSYTLYLIHEPLVHLASHYLPIPASATMRLILWQLVFVPAVTLLALFLFRWVEKPFVNVKYSPRAARA